jgi:hypothetical protein
MMTKHGAVEPGYTPSEVSGKPSEVIKQGSAIRKDEEAPEMRIEDVRVPEDPSAPN